jgi:hypothetical protein
MELRDILRIIFSPWVILGAVLFAGLLYLLVLFIFWLGKPEQVASAPATPIVTIIRAPTATLVPPTPEPSPVVTPPQPVPPPPPEGMLGVGAYVQVTGTGSDGLRLRDEPGLQGRVLLLALEAEVFQITGGPRQEDNYTWWYLKAPYEETREGWAAANYLAPIQSP